MTMTLQSPAWLQEPVYSNGMLDESSGATQEKQIQGQRKHPVSATCSLKLHRLYLAEHSQG